MLCWWKSISSAFWSRPATDHAAGSTTTDYSDHHCRLYCDAWPQFVNDASNYGQQIALLSLWLWVLAVAIDSTYALLAGPLHKILKRLDMGRIQNGLSGTFYLTAGTLLAGSDHFWANVRACACGSTGTNRHCPGPGEIRPWAGVRR